MKLIIILFFFSMSYSVARSQTISRLGRDDVNQSLHQRRLHNIKAYLTKYREGTIYARDSSNIIFVSGKKTDRLARIDIYFRGDIFTRFVLSKNNDLYVGECAVDLELYKSACDIPGQNVFYPCIETGTIRESVCH